MTAQEKDTNMTAGSQYIEVQFNYLQAFLEERRHLIQNYPWGGVIELPPCVNVGHIHPHLDEKICIAYTDREVDIVCAFGKLIVSVADYDEDDWDRDCPVDYSERSFDNWEDCARYIGELNQVPLKMMEDWIAAFQMME